MAENRGQIKILRANNVIDDNVKDIILQDGQPFYDKETKHLYIGEGNSIANSTPITADANNIVFYCESAVNAEVKEVNIPGYKLIENQRAFIIFKNGNSNENMQLKINGVTKDVQCYDYTGQVLRRLSSIVPNTLYRLTSINNKFIITNIYVDECREAWNVSDYINNKKISDIFENDGVTIKNSTNVKSQINGKNISDIFESNGTTVKNARNAQYASEGTSKGTIEERLTNLGFTNCIITTNSNNLNIQVTDNNKNTNTLTFKW